MSRSNKKVIPLADFPATKTPQGNKTLFTITTPHGIITRTTAREYTALAYTVVDGEIDQVSFRTTIQGAVTSGRALSQPETETYYGEFTFY